MPLLTALAPCFTAPSFETFSHLVAGWLMCTMRHVITQVIDAAGAVGLKHHSCFHRFFSLARWMPDEVGLRLLQMALAWMGKDAVVVLAVDDTLCRHTGPKISGAAMHRDPVRSKGRTKVCHWGHVWVVVTIIIEIKRWNKHYALPILHRLYRTKQVCAKEGRRFATKTDLAAEMLTLVSQAMLDRPFMVLGDNAYTNQKIINRLAPKVEYQGRASMKAALYEPLPPEQRQEPRRRGRPRVKGERLPSPAQLAAEPGGWQPVDVRVYGKWYTVQVKCVDALWYRVARARLMRFVLVRGWPYHRDDDVLCTTDLSLSAAQIITLYCLRWTIEVTFEEIKGKLGFEEPQNRTPLAVERTAPMALWLYTLTVLWYVTHYGQQTVVPLRRTPWYRKTRPAFSDMLAALRYEMLRHRITSEHADGQNNQKSLEYLLRMIAYAT